MERISRLEQKKERSRIRTEQEYVDKCIQYALSSGWAGEEQKDALIEKYLKPIYQKYLEIIEDLRTEKIPEDEIEKIISKMNDCLESTKRIGTTDPNNIIRSIEDYKNFVAKDIYTEYALKSLLEFVSATI
ncbi:MAG: hypothetical protein HYT28_02535 [Parcubacteria group bacterium]|nr:hypothetical protein [Parcubacteria group bacterium]